jgi:hypothetical protein
MSARQDREEYPFLLRVGDSDFSIKVRLRGKSRLRVCDFLPMRWNFKASETANTLFAGQDKIKLVVPCDRSERDQKDLLEEYVIYRAFNLLTPASYRVRLLHVMFSESSRLIISQHGCRGRFPTFPALR